MECFLPLYKSIRRWSDRKKEFEQPLFPGYLFCRFDFENRRPVVVTPGVQQIVGSRRAPVPVEESELEGIRQAIVEKNQLWFDNWRPMNWAFAYGDRQHVPFSHEIGRTEIEGAGGGPHPIPPLGELVELHERLALPARPARVAAIALNTRVLGEEEARATVAAAEAETGLPADDPVRFGAAKLVDAVLSAT